MSTMHLQQICVVTLLPLSYSLGFMSTFYCYLNLSYSVTRLETNFTVFLVQAPYLAGSGAYGIGGSGIGSCTAPATTPNAPGSRPLTWTTLSPPNDQGLAAALLNQPVKVCYALPSSAICAPFDARHVW